MRKSTFKARERPSRWSSGHSAVVMGIIMISAVGAVMASNVFVFFGGFILAWVVGFLGIFVFHVSNVVSNDGPAVTEYDGEIRPEKSAPSDVRIRLSELKGLRDEGLIDDEDYDRRKKEILDDV